MLRHSVLALSAHDKSARMSSNRTGCFALSGLEERWSTPSPRALPWAGLWLPRSGRRANGATSKLVRRVGVELFPPCRPRCRTTGHASRTARPPVVGGASGIAQQCVTGTCRSGPRTAHGVCLLREASAAARADRPGAGIIGTFGLIVKLGSATFEFLFSTVPKSTKSIGGAPEGRQCAPSLGRRVSPSLAELTVVEPD
jgi:hypothetical protein